MFKWLIITLFRVRLFSRCWLKLGEFWFHGTDGVCMDNVETWLSHDTCSSILIAFVHFPGTNYPSNSTYHWHHPMLGIFFLLEKCLCETRDVVGNIDTIFGPTNVRSLTNLDCVVNRNLGHYFDCRSNENP
jgi:hypothetical protein